MLNALQAPVRRYTVPVPPGSDQGPIFRQLKRATVGPNLIESQVMLISSHVSPLGRRFLGGQKYSYHLQCSITDKFVYILNCSTGRGGY